VRVVTRSVLGSRVLQQTADITWLQPTGLNLARLAVLVPRGFRQVPLAAALRSIALRSAQSAVRVWSKA
jgi:hypothetical protein